MQKAQKILKNNHVFCHTTVDCNEPQVRSFGFFMKYDSMLCVGTGKAKESYLQKIINPSIKMYTSSLDGKCIRIRDKAVEYENPDVLQKSKETNLTVSKPHNENTGAEFACFHIENGVVELADLSGNFEK